MIKKIINFFSLFFENDNKENYYWVREKLEKEIPLGSWLVYEGIDFYVIDYSSVPDIIIRELDFNSEKLYIVTEYYDEEKKEFFEKYFHEDFFKNRMGIFQSNFKANKK